MADADAQEAIDMNRLLQGGQAIAINALAGGLVQNQNRLDAMANRMMAEISADEAASTRYTLTGMPNAATG